MIATGYRKSLPIEHDDSLIDIRVPEPEPGERDLLVEVKAVSVNPVDTKVRRRSEPAEGETKILGFDACGTVVATGKEVTLFTPGEEVWYAGSIDRPGTNSEYHLVDERIAARKPRSIGFAEAAALPLTTITAWEILFERFRMRAGKGQTDNTLLVVGGAGGVGSILVQLARRLTGVRVVATASRPETAEWAASMGAHDVIDHTRPLSEELNRIGIDGVTHAAALTHSDEHFQEITACLKPFGEMAMIDDPGPADINLLKSKALTLHFEMMFTRPVFHTPDMIAQHRLLTETADLVDAGIIRTTYKNHFGAINAHNLKKAHEQIESGTTIGKIVLEGFLTV